MVEDDDIAQSRLVEVLYLYAADGGGDIVQLPYLVTGNNSQAMLYSIEPECKNCSKKKCCKYCNYD